MLDLSKLKKPGVAQAQPAPAPAPAPDPYATLQATVDNLKNPPAPATAQSPIADQLAQAMAYTAPAPAAPAESAQADTPEEQLAIYLRDLEAAFGTLQVKEALVRCLSYLDKHVELRAILRPDDIGTLVAGLRQTASATTFAKAAKKTERTAKAKEPTKKQQVLAQQSALDDLNFSL